MPIQDDFKEYKRNFDLMSDNRSPEQAYLEDIVWPETKLNPDALKGFNFRSPNMLALKRSLTQELNEVPEARQSFYMANFKANESCVEKFIADFYSYGPENAAMRKEILCSFITRCIRCNFNRQRIPLVDIPGAIKGPFMDNWSQELRSMGIITQ